MIPRRQLWIHNRLRKYRRKKFKRSDPQGLLYWRYWFKAFRDHKRIWEQEND